MSQNTNPQLDSFVATLDEQQLAQLRQALATPAPTRLRSRLRRPGKKVIRALAMVAILATGITTAWAVVDGNRATSDLLSGGIIVPYDGYLMVDSTPLNDTRTVAFELWDDADSTNDAVHLIWSETQDVRFYNGRFSVGLGSGTPTSGDNFDDTVLDGAQLYLAIQVQDSQETWVPLAGRQAIEAVPYAAWSANAADLNVAGTLDVGGNAQVGGTTQLNDSLTISKSGADATLLTFDTERPWRFSQTGADSAAHLRLSTTQNKWFQIMTGTNNGLQVMDTTGAVGFTARANGVVDVAGKLNVDGKIHNDHGDLYDVWIQGSAEGQLNDDRNLAMLGFTSTDTLYLNWNGEYAGGVRVASFLAVDGNTQVNGTLTATTLNTFPSGGYCVIASSSTAACPSGFTIGTVRIDTEDDGNGDSFSGSTGGLTDGNNSSIDMRLCCK
jgi:hypothetical protein